MANRWRRTTLAALGSLVGFVSAIAVSLATTDKWPSWLSPYRGWVWWSVGVLAVATIVLGISADARTAPDNASEKAPDREQGDRGAPRPGAVAPAPRTRITNLQPRNPNFTGRSGLLDEIHDHLTTAAPEACALYGLGGVGKTQIALEYAYRFASDYDIRWWIPSEQPLVIPGSLAALAQQLGLPDTLDQDELVERLLSELGRRDRWLLIFDNADAPQDILRYQPPDGGGHILITSRTPAWGAISRRLLIKPLPGEEAVLFLTQRTGKDDKAAARELADELGNLPLALEQAAAYMEQTGTSLGEYLQQFHRRKDELLDEGDPVLYGANVESTFELALTKAIQRSPSAAPALQLLAAFAPEVIPQSVLPDQVVEQGAILHGFSLVQRDEDGFRMHRLVRSVTRGQQIGGSPVDATGQAAQLVLAAWPKDVADRRSVSLCRQLLPHALRLEAEARHFDSPPAAMGQLLDQVALYLRSRGELAIAKGIATQAVAINEASLGHGSPAVARSLVVLAWVLRQGGQMGQARARLEQAKEILEATRGCDHPEVAAVLDELGIVLRRMGQPAAARAVHTRALDIRVGSLGSRHPDVAHTLRNLAVVERDLGELPRAQERLDKALDIFTAAYGPDHPETATVRDNLGIVLRRLGQPGNADQAHRQALKVRETIYGRGHPEIGCTVRNLGFVCLDLGDVDQAGARFEEALGIFEAAYDAENPDVVTTRDCLGIVRRRQGELAAAQWLHEGVLASREVAFGGEHPDVAATLHNLAVVLYHRRDLAGAGTRLERAISVFEAAYGADHPDVAMSLDQLGNVLYRLGETGQARVLQERAVAILEAKLGPWHADLAEALEHLAVTLNRTSDRIEARLHKRRAKAIRAGAARSS